MTKNISKRIQVFQRDYIISTVAFRLEEMITYKTHTGSIQM